MALTRPSGEGVFPNCTEASLLRPFSGQLGELVAEKKSNILTHSIIFQQDISGGAEQEMIEDKHKLTLSL